MGVRPEDRSPTSGGADVETEGPASRAVPVAGLASDFEGRGGGSIAAPRVLVGCRELGWGDAKAVRRAAVLDANLARDEASSHTF